MIFKECMEYINSYSKSGGRITDLSRAEELMERIGNPERRLKFVHIAGTNGKGSVVEYISNALILSGYKTGQFTSPFVLHYQDRIRINGQEIDEMSLCEICSFVKERTADRPYSQFEITMAIAMLWFEREKCDIVVLEAGIGGLLDCTNVIPSPVLSVITSISLDHTAILGDTVEKIAEQKAGIIKTSSAVVLSHDINIKKSVVRIIKNKAKQKNAEFIMVSQLDFRLLPMDSDGQPFIYRRKNYRTAMLGYAQPINAVTAIESCLYLQKNGFEISDENIKKSVETTRINARMQYIAETPPIIVDGGHNVSGIQNLASVIEGSSKPVYAVMGMIDSKDYEYGAIIVSRYADKVFTVDEFAPNAVNAVKLAEIASERTESEACRSLSAAVENAIDLADKNNGIVVICGSLYLASEFLNKHRGGNQQII